MNVSTETPADRLRGPLDRRVAQARWWHAAGVGGLAAGVAAGAWAAALLAGRITGRGVDAGLAAGLVLAAAGTAAWLFAQRSRGAWPTRLSIALAAERSAPDLGERISRATGFLDDRDGGGSAALKSLAIAQAAEVADRIATAPIAHAGRHAALAVAGTAALAIVALLAVRQHRGAIARVDARQAPAVGEEAARGRLPATVALATESLLHRIESTRAALADAVLPPHELRARIGALAREASESRAAFPGVEGAGLLAVFDQELAALDALVAPTGGDDPARTVPRDVVDRTLDRLATAGRAAKEIASAAGFEQRLSGLLADWFAEAPGLSSPTLTPRRRGAIAAAAALQRDALTHASRMNTALRGAAVDGPALVQATDLVAEACDAAGEDAAFADHRLAAAAEAAGRRADLLAKATGLLGLTVPEPLLHSAGDDGPTDEQPATARPANELLGRLESLALSTPRITAEASAVPNASSASTARPAAAGGGGQGAAPAEGSPSIAAGPMNGDFERLWTLLPEQSLPVRPGAGAAATFPSHRRAIDAYYRLLLERGRHAPGQPRDRLQGQPER